MRTRKINGERTVFPAGGATYRVVVGSSNGEDDPEQFLDWGQLHTVNPPIWLVLDTGGPAHLYAGGGQTMCGTTVPEDIARARWNEDYCEDCLAHR
jgi:hypothetical protein